MIFSPSGVESAIETLIQINRKLEQSIAEAQAQIAENKAKIEDYTMDLVADRALAEMDGRSWKLMKGQHSPEAMVKVPVYLNNVGAAFGAESREPYEGAD